tara:strand:+ start:455 stop:1069 length:615 start_codon:yes stop_codon:yes gene_type:complete
LGIEHYRRSVSESKRASILLAGRESFLRNGFSRSAVADIAREADVSTATLYKHFASKEELFAVVVREISADLGSEFATVSDSKDLRQVMHGMARHYLKAQFEMDANALLRIVIAEVPTTPQVAADMHDIIIKQRNDHLVHVFEQMIESKLLKPHDAKIGVDMIAGMIKEVFIWPALFDTEFTLPDNTDEILYEAIDMYLDHYAA